MRWFAVIAVMALCCGGLQAQEQYSEDEAGLRTFIDKFFTEFAARNPVLHKDEQKSATSLTAYVVGNFAKVSEENRRQGRIPPVDLVSILFTQGPKSWHPSNLKVSGDAARVDVNFVAASGNRPDVPLSFRLIKASDGWKFIRFIDLRPAEPEVQKEDIPEQSAADDPAVTVAAYLDLIVDLYNPANASRASSRLVDISKAIEPLWVETRDARRAGGQLQAQFSQMHPNAWAHIETALGDDVADVTVSLQVGNKMMLGNEMMLKMMGGEKPVLVFSLKKIDDSWKLTGFIKRPQ